MFSWLNKWEHASFGRNKMSVELEQKNLADLHWTFFMQHQKKKTSSATQKNLAHQHCTFFMQHQNMITSTAVKKTLSVSESF